MRKSVIASCYVALAAILWGVDSMVRIPGRPAMHGAVFSFYEHVLCLVLLVPFLAKPLPSELRRLSPRSLLPLFWVGVAGEAIAGLLFGNSFRHVGAAAAGFLQMLQPFCVLALVWALRRERAAASYAPWAMSVLIGALVIWIFDPTFDPATLENSGFWTGAALGLLAVTLWAGGNVAGKVLLETLSIPTLIFARWSLSLVCLAVILVVRQEGFDPSPLLSPSAFLAFTAHALLFALLPLALFYGGLRVLPVSLATFLELACPLALLLLPGFYGLKPMHQAQWLGGISVLGGVVLLLRLELEFLHGKARPRISR